MSKRENIVEAIADLLKQQRTVKLGRVERDPIIVSELPKTAYPAAYVESVTEEIEHLSATQRRAIMEVSVVVVIAGKERDTQKNIVVTACENTIHENYRLGGLVMDCRLSRVVPVSVGESAPFTGCRMIFTVEYCY
jgi:hypothetical protein